MGELLTRVTELLQGTLDSPWLWLIIFLVAGMDALLPFMPSETAVVALAVLLGSDAAQLGLLVLVAASGAFAGDVLSHAIGRTAGPGVLRRVQRNERGLERYEWARTRVERHAATLIVAARYLPGGRVASSLATGSLRYPLRRFLFLDAIGASVWAVYSVLIGFLGGASFAGEPVKGLLLAFALALTVLAGIEIVRRVWPRMRGDRYVDAHGAPESVGGTGDSLSAATRGSGVGRPGGAGSDLPGVDGPHARPAHREGAFLGAVGDVDPEWHGCEGRNTAG